MRRSARARLGGTPGGSGAAAAARCSRRPLRAWVPAARPACDAPWLASFRWLSRNSRSSRVALQLQPSHDDTSVSRFCRRLSDRRPAGGRRGRAGVGAGRRAGVGPPCRRRLGAGAAAPRRMRSRCALCRRASVLCAGARPPRRPPLSARMRGSMSLSRLAVRSTAWPRREGHVRSRVPTPRPPARRGPHREPRVDLHAVQAGQVRVGQVELRGRRGIRHRRGAHRARRASFGELGGGLRCRGRCGCGMGRRGGY
jgi:hypothetical protein